MARIIVHDIIAVVSGDGWRYQKARLLIDSDRNVAVFTPEQTAPVREFSVVDESPMRGQRVTLNTSQGEVKYRRQGSSCSWPLAKCRVPTKRLAERWPEEAPAFREGGPVESGVVEATADEVEEVLTHKDFMLRQGDDS